MNTKHRILEIFEENRGKSLSGEHLAGALGVSRNTIWKAVKELEKEGYQIEAVTNKGYCFDEKNKQVSAQGIRPFLRKKELAKKIYVYHTLPSTNKAAQKMVIENPQHGAVVIADHQTEGKGRHGREFFSPSGDGIYMSFILRPQNLSLETPAIITAFAAVCVCQAIEKVTGSFPEIKWVNDIFMENKKVCGIMTEAITDFESQTIEWIVLGAGINVTVTQSELPEDIRHIVGGVANYTKKRFTRNELIAEIINMVLTSEGLINNDKIFAEYKKRLKWMGEWVTIKQASNLFKGKIIDIDPAGKLIIVKENGEKSRLSSAEASIVT